MTDILDVGTGLYWIPFYSYKSRLKACLHDDRWKTWLKQLLFCMHVSVILFLRLFVWLLLLHSAVFGSQTYLFQLFWNSNEFLSQFLGWFWPLWKYYRFGCVQIWAIGVEISLICFESRLPKISRNFWYVCDNSVRGHVQDCYLAPDTPNLVLGIEYVDQPQACWDFRFEIRFQFFGEDLHGIRTGVDRALWTHSMQQVYCAAHWLCQSQWQLVEHVGQAKQPCVRALYLMIICQDFAVLSHSTDQILRSTLHHKPGDVELAIHKFLPHHFSSWRQ